jgi:hypothetical protein
LIERFWKYAKSEMLNGAHADAFAEFKLGIGKLLYEADKGNRPRVNSSASENFQLFGEVEAFECSLAA